VFAWAILRVWVVRVFRLVSWLRCFEEARFSIVEVIEVFYVALVLGEAIANSR
jgi:hypothetical protein